MIITNPAFCVHASPTEKVWFVVGGVLAVDITEEEMGCEGSQISRHWGINSPPKKA